jgi:phosphoribosylglycinamide formyltransferase-1
MTHFHSFYAPPLRHNIDMAAITSEDSPLTRLTRICLALPEAERQDSGSHAAFLVRKRIFAYFLNDHHGDGIVSVACKALPGDNVALAAAQPARFYLPAYIGPRGWIARRLDRGRVDWDEVAELVMGSYRLIAPKSLVKLARRP